MHCRDAVFERIKQRQLQRNIQRSGWSRIAILRCSLSAHKQRSIFLSFGPRNFLPLPPWCGNVIFIPCQMLEYSSTHPALFETSKTFLKKKKFRMSIYGRRCLANRCGARNVGESSPEWFFFLIWDMSFCSNMKWIFQRFTDLAYESTERGREII